MIDKYAEIIPEAYYHIYNRANGNEKLFLSNDNYCYFLKRYKDFISPIGNTYAYCLMPNHFHFLIQIKNEIDLMEHLKNIYDSKTSEDFKNNLSNILSQQFSHFFNSYTQAFNKQQNRMGSLFMKSYKRKPISNDSYRLKLVHYIHLNALVAGLCDTPESWPFSSYSQLIKNNPDGFVNLETIKWFDTLENFKHVHSNLNFKPTIDIII